MSNTEIPSVIHTVAHNVY